MKYIFLLISVGFYGFCVCQRSLVSTNDSHSIENKVTTTPQSRVVSLTTQGTGNTIEDAKNNALRSAIEQAFGVYISSNLVILNDSIIKDEIVSITSGNVQEFEILSQLKISDNEYLVSIKSTLSIYNLTKYFESKGVEIEFKGNSFVENIKLQKLNEDAEFKSILDICKTSYKLLKSSTDFAIHASNPIQVQGTQDVFQIKYEVTCTPNDNYNEFISYFTNCLNGISMNEYEVNEYLQLQKPVYFFLIYDNNKPITTRKYNNGRIETEKSFSSYPISLRDNRSVIALENFFIRANGNLLNFTITSNVDTIWGTSRLNSWSLNEGKLSFPNFYFSKGISSASQYFCFVLAPHTWDEFFRIPEDQKYMVTQSNMKSHSCIFPTESLDYFDISNDRRTYQSYHFGTLNLNDPLNFRHSIKVNYTLDQLNKIDVIKVERTNN